MHLKYYESTIQKEKDSNITNPKPPTTHPVYDKNVIKKEVLTPTLKKKADNLKTSYNFLKNYYWVKYFWNFNIKWIWGIIKEKGI